MLRGTGSRLVRRMYPELEKYRDGKLQSSDDFPGWEKATDLLQSLAVSAACASIVDIGGGANPMLSGSFVESRGIEYGLVDISQRELDKASSHYAWRACVDVAAPSSEFADAVGGRKFDMAFSHMFLEHVKDSRQAHRNIANLLSPGGLAVHFYPSPNNIPLALNRLLPEGLSTRIARFSQPARDFEGKQGKFPAYYKLCGNRGRRLHRTFEELGYSVLVHSGFVGHPYYKRIPLLDAVANAMVKPLIRWNVGLTNFQLLILRKV